MIHKNRSAIFTIWRIPVGIGSEKYYNKLSITYDNDIVYAADRKGIIKAISLYSGKELWVVSLSSQILRSHISHTNELLSGGLVIYDNKLYIGTESGMVIALNKNNGKFLWDSKLSGEVIAKPVIANGMLLIHTENGMLHALHHDTGYIKWSINLDHKQRFAIRGKSSPAIYNDLIIIGETHGQINAIMLKTGEIVWHDYISQITENNTIDQLHDINSTPLIDYNSNILFAIAYNGNLVAMDILSHKIIWSDHIGSVHDMILTNDSIYLVDQNDIIYKIRKADGYIIWENNSLLHCKLTAPALSNNNLLIADNNGYLYVLDSNNGELKYSDQINKSGFLNKPVVLNNNKLLIQAKDGILYYIQY